MSYEEIYLPLEEAVKLEAAQNLERDKRTLGDVAEEMEIYLEEARHILTTMGEGYLPDYPDHKLIKVKKEE